MFKIENAKELPKDIKEKMDESDEEEKNGSDKDEDEEEEEEEELRTGSPKILLTAVGIGYHNLTKTLI